MRKIVLMLAPAQQNAEPQQVSRQKGSGKVSPLRKQRIQWKGGGGLLPNLTLRSALLLQNMSHQVFSAIQSTDL